MHALHASLFRKNATLRARAEAFLDGVRWLLAWLERTVTTRLHINDPEGLLVEAMADSTPSDGGGGGGGGGDGSDGQPGGRSSAQPVPKLGIESTVLRRNNDIGGANLMALRTSWSESVNMATLGKSSGACGAVVCVVLHAGLCCGLPLCCSLRR